jgi:2-oxoglutarate ferredoxin oxidoreductase subunit alpha
LNSTNTEKILMKGNEAIAEAALRAGCRFYAGYPITPQNEISAVLAKKMPEAGGIFIQAESETAAINMVYGASAAGARAMTSSSSPGISLKQEGISYAAGADLPMVIVNVSRGGPGLGSIAPAQSDYFQSTRGGGHGDYRCIVLAPKSVQECAELTMLAFDLADKWRVPVLLLADGLAGQMMEAAVMPPPCTEIPARDWAVGSGKGRSPRHITSLHLNVNELDEVTKARFRRYERIAEEETRWEIVASGEWTVDSSRSSSQSETNADDGVRSDIPDKNLSTVHCPLSTAKNLSTVHCPLSTNASLVIAAYGSSFRSSLGARELAAREGIQVDIFRPVTLWPFPSKALADYAGGRPILVVEMSQGQMVEDVKLALYEHGRGGRVHFLGHSGGVIISEEEIFGKVKEILWKK